MQINNNYNTVSFSSLKCPVKPFIIETSKGKLYCSEIDYSKSYDNIFCRKISQFFLDIFANTSSHPFWKKCRKPTLDKKIYEDYIISTIADYKKNFPDADTTVLLAKDKNNNFVGGIHSTKLNLSREITDKDTLYIDGLAIKTEYRGQNIGKILLEKVIQASKNRFTDVFLVAYKESTGFYEKLNFKKMDKNDSAQDFAIKRLAELRIDYPKYADLMYKKIGEKCSDTWYERIKNNK